MRLAVANCDCDYLQGYELTDEEVNMPLDRFRAEYTNHDSSVK